MADLLNIFIAIVALTLEKLKDYVAVTALTFRLLLQDLRLESEVIDRSVLGWYNAQESLKHFTAKATDTVRTMAQHYRASEQHLRRSIRDHPIANGSIVSQYYSNAVTAKSKASDLIGAWIVHTLRAAMYWSSAFLRTTRDLGNALRSKEAFMRNNAGPWFLAAFNRSRRNAFLVRSRCVEFHEDWLHYYYSTIYPQYFTALKAILVLAFLYHFRHRILKLCYRLREAADVFAEAFRQLSSPLSLLKSNQLAMVLRKPLTGAYVYDPSDAAEHWPAAYNFPSTLQLQPPRATPTLTSLPSPLQHHILSLAITTASAFTFHPITHSLRLRTPCLAFHRAWRLARTLGRYLPGNTIILDACVAGATTTSVESFVRLPPSGREQLLDMLALLSLPMVAAPTKTLWMGRVAESMGKGEAWTVVVREEWRRVWSFDVGLMVACFGGEAFVRAFAGVRIEYRIVIGEEGKGERVVEMVRQLEEAARLGYRDERFKVVVEGLEAWKGVRGVEEYDGQKVVDLVKAAVEKMNVVG